MMVESKFINEFLIRTPHAISATYTIALSRYNGYDRHSLDENY